jgi:hypothetical protein
LLISAHSLPLNQSRNVNSFLYMPTLEDFLSHPIETLERALHIRKRIEELEEMLKGLTEPNPTAVANEKSEIEGRQGKRTMSAAARARIAEAQKLRWAKSKGFEPAEPSETAPAPKSKKKKGGMSVEGRARVAAAQKARWAAVKAQTAGSIAAKAAPAKSASTGKKMKRQLSPEARARIVAAQKKRWAKVTKGK